MADTQVKDMTEIVAPAATDVFYLQATPGGTPADKKVQWSTLPAPTGYISGLKLSNDGGDTAHDINVAVGLARSGDDTHNLKLSSAIVKQIDASWAVGTNAGGMDTGAVAANTWYYVWLIKRSDTGVVDVLFSLSNTSPTMPTNYDKKRRIGAVRTDGSSNIRAFTQKGDWFYWNSPTMDQSGAITTSKANYSFAASVPAGWRVRFYSHFQVNTGLVYISCPDFVDLSPSNSAAPLSVGSSTTAVMFPVWCLTNTSQQIAMRGSAVSTIRMAPLCYEDLRGQDGDI